ncbi:MAG: hypothetical protein H6718_00300 [Polyangiaceae bacterium]|nr:hypothetical protein [Polyangiaceae bacterium]MCB9607942.1 hypothetical protein [Polyangiaceae bacterium]
MTGTARKRWAHLVALVVILTTERAGADTEFAGWRGELEGHGSWIPGGGRRGAVGAGAGAAYGPFSAGFEVWHYQLTLQDALTTERSDLGLTVFVPLRVGVELELGIPQLVGGGDLALGFITDGASYRVGHCAYQHYGGGVFMARAFLGWVANPLALAVHVGATKGLQKASGDFCLVDYGPGPDPYRKDLPDEIPFSVQLGLTVTLSYP